MKDKRTVMSLAFCALLLLLLPCRAYAAGYPELTAEIPFSFRNDSSVPHTCTAVIEPVEAASTPEQAEAEAESGGEGRFVLCFSRPGTYRYRIYQTEKDISGVIYDDRVYTVTVVVRNGSEGGLAWSMWATVNDEEKTGAIEFINRSQPSGNEPGIPPEQSEKSLRTGDDSRLDLWFSVMVVSALTLVFIALTEKYGRKAGDGI